MADQAFHFYSSGVKGSMIGQYYQNRIIIIWTCQDVISLLSMELIGYMLMLGWKLGKS
jgi:hypothetical protein